MSTIECFANACDEVQSDRNAHCVTELRLEALSLIGGGEAIVIPL